MVKTPKTRHSKPRTEPLTIDLEADQVTRSTSKKEPETTAKPDTAAKAPSPAAPERPTGTTTERSETPKSTAGMTGGPSAARKTEEPAATSFGRNGKKDGGQVPPPTGTDSATKDADRKPGRAPVYAAGLVGAVIALTGAGALQWTGLLPSPGSADGDGAVETLRGEIAAMREEIAALESAGGVSREDLDAVIAGPAQRIDTLSADVNGLKSELADLRTALAAGEGGEAPGLAALEKRLADVETALAALGTGDGAGSADIGAVEQRVATIETQIGDMRETLRLANDSLAGTDGRISAIEQEVRGLAERLDEQAEKPDMAIAIAAAALRSAIDRGTPFTAELETFAALAPDSETVEALREYAAGGIPTRAAIAAGTEQAAIAMIDADDTRIAEGGFFARLWESAQSLIKVRPIGDVAGTDVPAIVARMELALDEGNYDKAIAEYETLPEPSKAAGADFMARVRARNEADRLVARLMADALAAS
ncbi:MAG: mitofilin family membrane protein [Rhizobiaceae bacterium]|nr:mitofilin family membrane protein [Rhizobiaceae bacterium]